VLLAALFATLYCIITEQQTAERERIRARCSLHCLHCVITEQQTAGRERIRARCSRGLRCALRVIGCSVYHDHLHALRVLANTWGGRC
jgi:hypothetical protein